MRKFRYLPLIFLAFCAAISSCDDDVTTIGSSLITDQSEIVIDSSFVLSGHSVRNESVQSRTVTQLIGRIQAEGFGSLSSEIVTQFMSAVSLDTVGVGVDDITSMEMLMFFDRGSFTGDSLAPMGLKVYPLTKQLPSPIFSNFDPKDYYDASSVWNTEIYTGNALHNDSLNNLNYRTIRVSLPLDFAKKFYKEFLTNPSTFATPQSFTRFFPGLYITNSFGQGRITNVKETRINMYYQRHDTYSPNDSTTRDTIYNLGRAYMAVTPEVITNNIIKFDISDELKAKVAEGQSLLVAPAGYDVELNFPASAIVNAYNSQAGKLAVINTLTMTIPCEKIENDYGIEPPQNILMVLKKDKDSFFAKNSLTDNAKSFLASYDSATNSYVFSDMRQYILDMLSKGSLTGDDYTFILTPVYITTETSSGSYYSSGTVYTTSIAPYVTGPAMVKLKLDEAKIKLTFGKQSTIF